VSIANPTPKGSWVIGCSAVLAILLPGAIMLGLIAHDGVNVPFWDEWSLIPFFQKAHDHALTFRDFFIQNNEHRIVFPKLIFLILYRFGLWTPRAAMFSSLFLVVLTGVGLQWLLWQTLRGTISGSLINVSFFVTGFLLFSPCQFENWLWGYQLPCFLLNFSLIAGIVVMCLALPLTVQFLLAATCAIIATFSAGNGMLLWPLLWSTKFLRPGNKTRPGFFLWSGAWLAAAVCAIGFYFYDYRKPAWHPPLAASHEFFDYVYYLLSFLGSALGRRADTASLASAITVGFILLVIFALPIIVLARRWNHEVLRARAAPWVAVAGFAVLSACVACITRIGFGPTQALASRYTTFSLLFPISLIPLVILLGQAFATKRRSLITQFSLGLWTVIVALFTMTLPFGIQGMQRAFQARAMGRAALTFLKSMPQKHLLETTVHPSLAYLTIFAPRADALHLLHPPLIGPDTLKQLMNSAPVTDSHCGTLDKIETSLDNMYKISGRTAKCDSQCSADCIILSYAGRQTQRMAFTLAFPVAGHSEWNASFLGTTIPGTSPHEIDAWAFDISRTHLCKLDGRLSFP
jgi:hypothetical protein